VDSEDVGTKAESKDLPVPPGPELTIAIPGCGDLPDASRAELVRVISNFGQIVLQEAGRLEAGSHSGPGPAMITPSHMSHAATWAQSSYVKPPVSTKQKIFAVLSYLAAIICGLFVNNIDKAWGSIGLVICSAAGFAFFMLGGS
jgi:hypothetical protein